MTTETTDTVGFSYMPVDASEVPTRPRPVSPGRPSSNPHTDVLKNLAGTGEARAFTLSLDHDADEVAVKRLVNRHTRWLRTAAHENDRGVRVWPTEVSHEGDDGTTARGLRISFKDIPYTRRPRKANDTDPTLFEGSPE